MRTFLATASALLLSTTLAAAAAPPQTHEPAGPASKPAASDTGSTGSASSGAPTTQAAKPATPTYGSAQTSTSGAPAMAGPAKMHPMSHRRIEEIQAALNNKGEHLSVDGIWGPKTRAAIEDFQKQNHLKVTGRADRTTLHTLQPQRWS